MSTQHTPGPWTLVQNWRDKMAVVGPGNVGDNTSDDRICNLPQRKHGEGRANGHLIAAAPELFAFAQWVRESPLWHDMSNDERDRLDSLIAKAEGNP